MGAWLRELPVAAKVGDWFFCHAGDTEGKQLSTLRSELQKQMSANGFSAPLLTDPHSLLESKPAPHPWWEEEKAEAKLKAVESKEQADAARIQHDKGKKGAKDATKARKDETKLHSEEPELRKQALGEHKLKSQMDALGVKHLVFGHYPGKVTFADGTVREPGQIYQQFKGMVYMIDTGMSRGESVGNAGLLHIQPAHGHTSAIWADGKSVNLVQ